MNIIDQISVKGSGYTIVDESKLTNVTYSQLVDLRDNNELIVGARYRITDYATTTTQEDTQSANHPFDIIVTAFDDHTLSENASAIRHNGDTYFQNSKLEAWKIKYSLDNDTDRFLWADTTNGKGVIYYMKDEWNNECPYDFKNIQFKRYKITAATKSSLSDLIGKYSTNDAEGVSVNTSNPYWVYTFTMIDTATSISHDVSVEQDTYYSNEGYCYKTHDNVFETYFDTNYDVDPPQNYIYLPNNAFVTDTEICAIDGTYGEFYAFYNNTFGNSCYYNTFGNNCGNNTFGNDCWNNTFGNDCGNNTFGNYCYRNTFGNGCNSNTFGNNGGNNTFGNYCGGNTFGNYFQNNTFGNSCYYNTFGNSCNQIRFAKDYMYYNIVENGNQYITLTSTAATDSSNKIQNITIAQGVNNSPTVKTISHDTVNDTFKTTYQNSNSQIINA